MTRQSLDEMYTIILGTSVVPQFVFLTTETLSSPSEYIEGKALFEWFEDETFIIMRSEATEKGPPGMVSMINQDDINGQA